MTAPTADLHELRVQLERDFADLLAPDLKANSASKIHIDMTRETDLTTSGEFAGLHSPRNHRWLRSYIPNWTGPAPTMLIDDATITNDCGGRWSEMKDRFVSIATHELGHVCCVPGLFDHDADLPPEVAEVVRQFFTESLATKSTFFSSSPRVGHGPEWIRTCCHLVHRMQQRGFEVRLPQVIDNDYYEISSTSKYSHALGDECERLADWPICSIASLPPPQSFLDLWNADCAEWPDGSF